MVKPNQKVRVSGKEPFFLKKGFEVTETQEHLISLLKYKIIFERNLYGHRDTDVRKNVINNIITQSKTNG